MFTALQFKSLREKYDRIVNYLSRLNSVIKNDRYLEVGFHESITRSAFGDLVTTTKTPFVQSAPVYDLLPANFRAYTATGGAATVENQMFKAATGTSSGGYGAIQSFRSINYKPGFGGECMFTAMFESNVASSWQGAGLVNLGDELSFGYNGTSFGVWHRKGGEPEIRTLTITGAAGGAENATVTLNGTGYTVPLTAGTVEHNAYEVQKYFRDNDVGWGADQVDDTVIFSATSDGAKSGSYSFSSSTATGTFGQDNAGVTKTSTHIAQDNWNGRTVSIDPTKLNVYRIRYPYLGAGSIFFDLINPATNEFVTVHTINYPNQNTSPSLGNPSLRFGIYAVSLGSTTDLVVRSASVGGFVDGEIEPTRNPRAVSNTQAVGSSFLNILTIRNRRTYNSLINQVEIAPQTATFSGEGAKNWEIEIRATTNPGVEQNFTAAGSNLVSDVDYTAAAITSGSLLASATAAPGATINIDLSKLAVRLPPTVHLAILAKRSGASTDDCSASLTYYEDL